MRIMMNNSAGRPSSSVTFAWIAFVWCLSALTVGLLEELTFGDTVVKFRMLDAGIVLSLLTPAFGLYGFRRWIDKRFDAFLNNQPEPTNESHKRKKRRVDNPDEEDLKK